MFPLLLLSSPWIEPGQQSHIQIGTIARRLCQRDVHRTQAAPCLFDLEADGLTLVEQADFRGQVGAVYENITRTVIARKEAVALGFVKEFDFPFDGHLLTL
jgi:hypothetical protein